jgi:hypothetical protein
MSHSFKIFLFVVGWSLLFALIRPLALLALILFPIIWLLSLPLRFLAMGIRIVPALIRATLLLPAHVLDLRKDNTR